MELKVRERSNTTLVVEIEGEEHTLGNLLVKQLGRESHVKVASYYKEHPLTDSIVLRIETDGQVTPEEAIKNVIGKIMALSERFEEEVKNGTEKGKSRRKG
ncbi:DNA-directed RNA polymerase subunit L [Sulfolobales archaeon HS-7]|nr:DNA-directed RNA polymerase subunit L [Sulfolobales archaeon HS-7]